LFEDVQEFDSKVKSTAMHNIFFFDQKVNSFRLFGKCVCVFFLNQQNLLINKYEQLELAQEVHKTKAEDTRMKNQPAITNSSEAQPKTKTRQRQQKTQQN
jgi:hypothetical protein